MTTSSSGRARRNFGRGVLGSLAAFGVCLAAVVVGPVNPAGAAVTGLSVQSTGAARYVPATDGQVHIEYNLLTANPLPTDATLKSLVVRTGQRTVLELRGDALARITQSLNVGIAPPVDVVPSGSSVVSLVDVQLAKSARDLPRRLTSIVRYTVASGPLSNAVDRHQVAVRTRVIGRAPVVISPPLRGSGWWGANACCDPAGSHRRGFLAIDGVLTPIEVFAIDYIRIVKGSTVGGDGAEVTDAFAYGEPIHNVARGRVVAVHRGVPNALWPPPESGPPNPALNTSADYTGNSVIVKIARGRFALYAHMVPGSIRVKKGQLLRSGQIVGKLGNTGNSSAPHLHFAIQSRPRPLAGSRPYVFDQFQLEGFGAFDPSGSSDVLITPKPRREHKVYPLAGAIATFSER
jgi:Peptidase family M23